MTTKETKPKSKVTKTKKADKPAKKPNKKPVIKEPPKTYIWD